MNELAQLISGHNVIPVAPGWIRPLRKIIDVKTAYYLKLECGHTLVVSYNKVHTAPRKKRCQYCKARKKK